MIKIQLCRYLWRHLRKNQEMSITDWVWVARRFDYDAEEILNHVSWLSVNGFFVEAKGRQVLTEKSFGAISNHFTAFPQTFKRLNR